MPVDDIALLQDTQSRWVSWVGGDKGAKDIARVLRLPGSRNHKPKYAPDYPTVKIEDGPTDISRRYKIMDLRNMLPIEEPPRAPALTPMHSFGDRGAYVAQALRDEYDRVANARPGERNTKLNKAAYYLGTLIAAKWANISRLEVERTLTAAAVHCGLDKDPDCGMNGIAKSIASGVTAGMQVPRNEPPPLERNGEAQSRSRGRDVLERVIFARRSKRAK
jgi:hypothetical protein